MIKTIKTDSEYQNALARIEELMDLDPEPNTREGHELELLSVLIENYEREKFQTVSPDPVEAIMFRMEQQNLTQRDLVPFIGSRSKVSEILSRKRPLTLSMIKALHNGLGIPAKALLQETDLAEDVDWDRFPIQEMLSRGWLKDYIKRTFNNTEAIRKFFEDIKPISLADVLYKRALHLRSARSMDQYALAAWTARVINVALQKPPTEKYKKGVVDADLMRAIVRLSVLDNGPLVACDFLGKQGIAVVIEPHLPNTYLDGSAILANTKYPIIGLTLRYDRVDNFWFCLMHELAHIHLHLDKGISPFYDDLDVEDQGNLLEIQADTLAGEVLIPQAAWKKSPASKWPSPDAAQLLAKELSVHPAIVAGKIRHKSNNYRILNNLVGHNKVRELFKGITWK